MSAVIEFFKKLLSSKNKDLEIPDVIAEDCMVSRANIPVIYLDSSLEEVKHIWKKNQQRFLVVCDDGLDDIVGIADIFFFDWDGQIKEQPFSRPVFIAPTTELKTFCLDLFQGKNLYIVVDEFGGTKGAVTIESVLSYILNFSKEVPKTIHSEILVDGKMPLKNLFQMIESDMDIEEFDSKTVGGFVMEYLGKIPALHEIFYIGNIEFFIEEIEGRQIKTVKIKRLKQDEKTQ